MQKKSILIILDGLADRSYREFDYKTPLQAAKTPCMDELAARGTNGIYHAASLGQALPSENAHFIMFGYDMSEFPGRGALEALGAKIKFGLNDVCVLSHFASLYESDKSFIIRKGKPEISRNDLAALIDVVKEYETLRVNIRFNPTGGIRGIITLQGNVAPYITDSDPFKDGCPLVNIIPWHDYSTDTPSRNAAMALKAYLIWVHHQLKNHPVNQNLIKKGEAPVNGIVTQRAGRLKKVTPFNQKYGFCGLSIASGMLYWGLSTFIGIDAIKVTDSEDPGKDLSARLKLAKDTLNEYDFVHIHTKAPDEAAHTKNPLYKKSVIESLDAGLGEAIGPLMDDPEVLIILTSDHSTPSSGPLIHSGESVPLTFYGEGTRRDNVTRFDEISVASGALGVVHGKELIYLIINHMDRSKLHGIMDTPIDQPYWPGNYEPFCAE